MTLTNTTTRYNFRAEVLDDALQFLRTVAPYTEEKTITYYRLPDVQATFRSSFPLDKLIEIANDLEDCHVIAQTLEVDSDYTGTRTLNR